MKKPKSRRGRGEGAISQRANGRWYGQLSMGGRGAARKRVTVSGKSKAEVVDKMARARAGQLDGTLPEPSAMTVGQWLTHWEKTVRDSGVAISSADYYARRIRLHLMPTLGEIKLQKLRTADIELCMSRLTTLAKRKLALRVLSRAMLVAKRQGLITVNPCDNVTRPRVPKGEIRPLDQGQARQFLASVAGHQFETLFTLALGTGARQGELMAAHWGDVDLEKRTWNIRRTISDIGGGKVVTREPKTKAGQRTIVLDSRSVAALVWNFKSALRRASLPAIRFHDLRHTHATLMLSLPNCNIKTLSARLGHASIVITLDTYSHVMPGQEADAVENFDKLFS